MSWKSLIRQMVKTNYSGSADLFTGGLFRSPFPDLKKMALCCSHGLVTFDLKIRCEVRRLSRRVLVASVEHRYMMHCCVLYRLFFYKNE